MVMMPPERVNWREARLAYLLLAPSAILLSTFGFAPLVYAFVLSLRERGLLPGAYVGFDNYAAVLTADPKFWRALRITLMYVLGTVPPTLIIGYGLAELLHRAVTGRALYRTLFFLPY